MASSAGRREMQVHILQQEALRLDAHCKHIIDRMPESVSNERELQSETRVAKEALEQLRGRVEALAQAGALLPSRSEQQDVLAQVATHEREMDENAKALRAASIKARRIMGERARAGLMSGEDGPRQRRRDGGKLDAEKTTERLTNIVAKMHGRVAQSEADMQALAYSSAVLQQTQQEYESQASHIHTGSKLLSKYERRELTDKVLIFIAFLLYCVVMLYILQKRVFTKFFWFW